MAMSETWSVDKTSLELCWKCREPTNKARKLNLNSVKIAPSQPSRFFKPLLSPC